jgi:hypothetical protein
MLTRWEEYVNKTRDNHDRFPGTESLAYKNDFLERPIVNEYVEMLWNMLVYLGFEGQRKKRSFEIKVSHDVDEPYNHYNLSFMSLSRVCVGDILKRKKIFAPLKKVAGYLLFNLGYKKLDSFNTFDFLMNVSEKNHIKSNFYFKAGFTANEYDSQYANDDRYIVPLISYISKRGHNIGLHPSYHTYLDENQITAEFNLLKQRLDKLKISSEVIGGRQHYLRFAIPYTWRHWDQGLSYDSSLGYADHVGFRCGTCYNFHTFNFLERKQLSLVEYPLIVMEGTIFSYMNLSYETGLEKMCQLKDVCRKYNGIFTLLWHNSHFQKKEYFKIYKKVIEH